MDNVSQISLRDDKRLPLYDYKLKTSNNDTKKVVDRKESVPRSSGVFAMTSQASKEEDDIGKATWDDYIGNTTFHGCRFIFGGTKSKIRK